MSDTVAISPINQPPAAERRQVSVLFTDMVGYTAIVDELGEEKALVFTQKIYKRLTSTVQKHGGSVRGFAGDSIMALFGIPEAQEDAALRACRSALAIQAEFSKSADEFEAQFNVRPTMRVGVSSGVAMMAVVEGDNAPVTAVGSTVNLASRIEAIAPMGGCLICDATRRMVEWVVDLDHHSESKVKGLAKSQKLWLLKSIRTETKRFDASVARGLSKFSGRDLELSIFRKALDHARETIQWIDLVAEPGLGKTRLIFEFLETLETEDTLILRGYCSVDGRQTPFLPFIELVRSTYEIRDEDDRELIVQKLEVGLEDASLNTSENLGLLLSLLGRHPPPGALDGLDGVLIGLRMRTLLAKLLKAQHSLNRVILLIEDIHWLDGSSEELLSKLYESDGTKNLLVINTRRPHYNPSWLETPKIVTIGLSPLTSDDIAHLAESWLGVDAVPDALIERLTERAEGNPLFVEEILSYLLEEGALSIEADGVNFNASSTGAVLPASMQSLLTSRIDRLSIEDRAFLQVAAAIGQRFFIDILSLVLDNKDDVKAALLRLVTQELVYRDVPVTDYVFKHTMLRETVYQSMIEDRKADLHLAIAQALEKRYEDRLAEKADTLAYHYGLTDQNDLAFKYTTLAGAKSMGIFALDEANQYFEKAVAIYERDPTAATKEAFAAFMADYALCLNISLQVTTLIDLADKFRPTFNKLGDTRHHALFLHHYTQCLLWNGRYSDAHAVRQELTDVAGRLGDPLSLAYARLSEISVSNFYAAISSDAYGALSQKIEAALEAFDDPYLRNFFLATVGWNEITRGRVTKANLTADRILETGLAKNDPRSLGYGRAQKALIAMLGDDQEKALEFAEQALSVSRTEYDTASAAASIHSALIQLDRPNAMEKAQAHIDMCVEKGWILFIAGPEVMQGVGLAMQGRIGEGLRHIEAAIARREAEGYEAAADWYRLSLCEIYLAVLSGEGDVSAGTLMRNAGPLAKIILFGPKRILSLVDLIRANPQFESDGHYIARCELILGILYKIKKKTGLAKSHLIEAQRIVKPSGSSPMLTRIETALEELGSA